MYFSDCLEIAGELRKTHPELGIIMVTGSKDEIDRIVGLEVGADDYVAKPVNERGLLARIRSLQRRLHVDDDRSGRGEVYVIGDCRFEIDAKKLVNKRGEAIQLSEHELKLLTLLVRKTNPLLTNETWLENCSIGRQLVRVEASILSLAGLELNLRQPVSKIQLNP